jgi:hypothetical protein
MNNTTVFHIIDVATVPPLTPAQAKELLNELFKCGYETVSDQKAKELLSNIDLIQKNYMNNTLSATELWRLFELDPNYGPWVEEEEWMMPGYSMNVAVITIKKSLHARLYPGAVYETTDINGN